MPNLNFSYDTGNVSLSRIVDAIAAQHRYQSTINGSPNPETKANFARRMIKEHIINIVKNQDLNAAVQSAQATVSSINLD